MGEILSFNANEILADKPRKLAEAHPSPYGKVIAKALQQDVNCRTQSAIEFWRELLAVHEDISLHDPQNSEAVITRKVAFETSTG